MKPNVHHAGDKMGSPTRAQRFLRGAKRAGVAVGGGTMVGVGLVFIPTLPPPFGEALIVGGVSLLGTEFEGPKRVVKNARDSFERAVGRDDDDNADTTASVASSVVESTSPDDATLKASNVHRYNPAHVCPAVESIAEEDCSRDSGDTESAVAGDALSSTSKDWQSTPPHYAVRDRFKKFGRKVVLPFLDQVVGDQNEDEKTEDVTAGI